MNQIDLENIKNEISLGNVLYLPKTSSTNDIAKNWLTDNTKHFSLIVANEQTRGRGRLDRRWVTPPNASLAFTIILTEEIKTEFFSRYAGLGSLAVCETLQNITEAKVSIKWPNDILIEQYKVGGVLVESHWVGERLKGIMIGIGINIRKESIPPEIKMNFPPTYLDHHTTKLTDRKEILKQILIFLKKWYSLVDSPEFILAWDQSLAFKGRNIQIKIAGNHIIEGQLKGLGNNGEIVIMFKNGEIGHFNANEISIRPA